MATHSRREIRKTNDRSKRLLIIALLAGVALVATSHDAYARRKRPETACLELGGAIINDQCCFRDKSGEYSICSPVSRSAGAAARNLEAPAPQNKEGGSPTPQSSTKSITPKPLKGDAMSGPSSK